MSWKNFLIRHFVRFAKSQIPQNQNSEKRILVVATTALGDTLWATPALESLRKSFPQAYIAVLTSPIGKEVLKHNPWINRLYLLKEPLLPRFFSLWRELAEEKFDTVLLFHASQRLALPLCALLGASQIVGTVERQKGLDSLLTDPLPNVRQHEIVRRLKMVEQVGGKVFSQTLSLFLQPEEKKALPEGRWIALHPGSKDSFKRWPAENFASLGRMLQQEGYQILITGTLDETKPLKGAIPGALIFEENLSFRAFASLLEQVELLISNDTGPVHVACALKCPVIALYVPTDPVLCGPHLAPDAIALAKRPTCTPCLKRKCRRPFCFLQISPREVYNAAKKIFIEKEKIQ